MVEKRTLRSGLRGTFYFGDLQTYTIGTDNVLMRWGLVYLFAVLDLASNSMLAWRLSITLATDFCLDAVRR